MPSVVPMKLRVSSAVECVEGRAHTDSQVAIVLVKGNVVEGHVGRVMDGRAGQRGWKVDATSVVHNTLLGCVEEY